MNKIANFIGWLQAQVGSIYVWGAQGETATESLICKMETSETNAKRALKLYQKRVSEGITPKMYDCSGLIICYFLKNGLIAADTTAAGLYSKCKVVKKSDLKAGDLVFRHNGTKIHHVGVYIGGGMVIHSKGRDAGVVKEHIDYNGANYWNKFGRFELLQKEGGETMETVIKKTTPLMKGEGIKQLQTALNALGYRCGTADGIAGDKTIAAIIAFADKHTTQKLPNCLSVSVQAGNKVYKGDVK